MRAKELLHKIKSARGRMMGLALIEADRREAKLEALRELRRRMFEMLDRGTAIAWQDAHEDMVIELEKGGGTNGTK